MQNFQANLKRLEAADTQVLGISIDSPPSNGAWAKQINVDFPLLSDMDHKVLTAYGLSKEYDIKGAKILAARRMNYLIDKDGKVVEMQVDNDAIDPSKVVDICERKKLKE
jgi:thioredoxin-dependent peroxiredoxin